MTTAPSLEMARTAAQIASDKLGENIVGYDVRKITAVTDVYLFVGAISHVHVRAVEDAIREGLRLQGARLLRTDGHRGHSWRVLDYGGVIIHIMDSKTRELYGIERLWEEGKKLRLFKEIPVFKKKPILKRKAQRRIPTPKKSRTRPKK